MKLSILRRVAGIAALTLAAACALPAQSSGSAGRSIAPADASGSAVVSYHSKWNLVSTPFVLANNTTSAVFPTAVSSAYRYAGGYVFVGQLTAGTGYWLKFPGAGDVTFSGDDIPGMTLDLLENWNLIGSISRPVAVADVTTDDSTLVLSPIFGFGYAAGYVETDTIHPGYGYWVYANHAGSITLPGSPSMKPATGRPVTIKSNGELPPGPPPADDPDGSLPPESYFLDQSYPNPFNPSTTIRFRLPSESRVTLTIHDMAGRLVAIAYEGVGAEGFHSVEWNAGDRSSGMYVYRLTAVSLARPGQVYSTARKMLLMK